MSPVTIVTYCLAWIDPIDVYHFVGPKDAAANSGWYNFEPERPSTCVMLVLSLFPWIDAAAS